MWKLVLIKKENGKSISVRDDELYSDEEMKEKISELLAFDDVLNVTPVYVDQ